jgi:two-component system, response regulator YesN
VKIVIVEDEIRIREGIKKLLIKLNKEEDMIVAEAENGQEGLELIGREKPDVVITDVKMPVLDGLEMLKQAFPIVPNMKAIVLSAYSEFEYARTAMKLGVTEYLLKPIVLSEFMNAMESVRKQIENDKNKKPEEVGSLSQVFKSIINGDMISNNALKEYLFHKYEIGLDQPISLLVWYNPIGAKDNVETGIRFLKSIMMEKTEIQFCFFEEEKENLLYMALYGYKDGKMLERWIQQRILRDKKIMNGCCLGWVEAKNIDYLQSAYKDMSGYLDWNISLGDNVIITYPNIKNIQTSVCIYPIEIEKEIKLAICNKQKDKITNLLEKFHSYFQNDKIYEPGKIKECYVRFYWAIINIANEINSFDYGEIEQKAVLEKIVRANSMNEIKAVTNSLIEKVEINTDNDIKSITVRRAIAIIHEYYQAGITLEEIAKELNITPEYLGTQIHKELGVNFSSYIKNYRITKAKELLLSTSLKIYEIAEKTGYADPKYFSKVFKGETGQLPAEFRHAFK